MKVAILGAECTGKTQLVQALSVLLQARHPDLVSIPEYLRSWCAQHGRTPLPHEQAAIALAQMEGLQQQAASLLLCDTTSLMTAVYSDVLFGDNSLYATALAQHQRFDLTLVTGLDLPWVADGLQRDGAAMRARVDQRLREVLRQHGLGYSMVLGSGEARTQCALQAIDYAQGRPRTDVAPGRWQWNCEKCSDPACEHQLFRALLKTA